VTGRSVALLTAAWVVTSGWTPSTSLQRLGATTRQTGRSTPFGPRGRGRSLVLAAVAVGALGSLLGAAAQTVAGAVAAVAVGGLLRRVLEAGRARRVRRFRQRRVVVLCDALAAELRGGLPMSTVIRRCCGDDVELAPIVHAAELGGDVAGAFRRGARLPGAVGLRAIAAAWDIAGSTGSALAGVLDRISAGLRDDEEARAEVAAALGPPRATAKLLAVLPLFGLALGASIDAHPVRFLLGTTPGLLCLAAGTALALLGLWWVERLAAGAEV
jgi:tight adherence protein B